MMMEYILCTTLAKKYIKEFISEVKTDEKVTVSFITNPSAELGNYELCSHWWCVIMTVWQLISLLIIPRAVSSMIDTAGQRLR